MLMCRNLSITLVHFLKLQYSIPSNELVLLAKVETQGLDLPSCLKQPKNRQKIWNDEFQDTGLQATKDSDLVRQEINNFPISLPWESYRLCAGQGWTSRAWWLLSWEDRAESPGKSWWLELTRQKTRGEGFIERKLRRCGESLSTIQLNIDWHIHLRKAPVLGKNHPKGLEVTVPAADTVWEECLLSPARLENVMTHKIFGWNTQKGLTLISEK